MSNFNNGLRFEVYERVHLSDEAAGIDELEEIELIPRIQVNQEDDQVVLQGHLHLSGYYRSELDEGVSEVLEHWIPVEITLPLNRVSSLDDISIEIDNFDVEVLSARTLNITGVLSLVGIELDAAETTYEQRGDEEGVEEFTATHTRDALGTVVNETRDEDLAALDEVLAEKQQESVYDAVAFLEAAEGAETGEQDVEVASYAGAGTGTAGTSAYVQEQSQFESKDEAETRRSRKKKGKSYAKKGPSGIDIGADPNVQPGEMSDEEIAELVTLIEESDQQTPALQQTQAVPQAQAGEYQSQFAEEAMAETNSVLAGTETAEAGAEGEERPLSVRFTGKESGEGGVFAFHALLESSYRRQQAKQSEAAALRAQAERLEQDPSDNAEELKSHLLGEGLAGGFTSAPESFRTIRIAIAQPEDTVERIAERFQIQVSELALRNESLTTQEIEAGQAVFLS